MKISDRLLKITNIVCAVIILALVVLQFMPFWTVGETTLSAQEYIWFCRHHIDFEDFFIQQLGDAFSLNAAVLPTVGILAFGCLSIYFCIAKSNKSANWVWTILCGGLSCVFGFLTTPVYQMGSNWIVHLILGVVVCLISIVLFIRWIDDVKHWIKG